MRIFLRILVVVGLALIRVGEARAQLATWRDGLVAESLIMSDLAVFAALARSVERGGRPDRG